jgi:hypothetical protein
VCFIFLVERIVQKHREEKAPNQMDLLKSEVIDQSIITLTQDKLVLLRS